MVAGGEWACLGGRWWWAWLLRLGAWSLRLVTLRLETKEVKWVSKWPEKNREKSWCGWFHHKRQSGNSQVIRHAIFMLLSVKFICNRLYSLSSNLKYSKLTTQPNLSSNWKQGLIVLVCQCAGQPSTIGRKSGTANYHLKRQSNPKKKNSSNSNMNARGLRWTRL
jgi:hypothetical protein